MSTNKNLFKEAIADAKAVREAALANAKAALQEALTPRLQSMLSTKLQEMEKEEYELEETFTSAHDDSEGINLDFNLEENEDELEEDFDLSEILAELAEEDETIGEAKKKNKVLGSKAAEKESEETYPGAKEKSYIDNPVNEAEDEESEEENDEEEVGSMSIDALKDLITSIIHGELEHEEYETSADEAEEAEEADEETDEEDEIDLEELLAELEEKELEEANKINSKFTGALKGLKGYTVAKGFNKVEDKKGTKNGILSMRKVKEEEELEEAIATINTLRNELNETNLLNAKLLYVNKIFKAKNLTESQKLKVIASFDKATNVKEAKIVFESLNNTITTPAKKTIKESFGFASKAAGVAPNRTIVESNDVISRMQKLANIIK